jgi:hypothetical protein
MEGGSIPLVRTAQASLLSTHLFSIWNNPTFLKKAFSAEKLPEL